MSEYNVISEGESTHLQGLQQKGIHIIKAEKERLERKKDNIVSRANNAERMILLNQTYQLKQKQYLILIMIFVVTLAICALIIFMQERLGVKKTTLDMLMIAVVVIGFISAYFTYNDILSRDKINFNKLSMDHVDILSPAKLEEKVQEMKKEGKITNANAGTCYGPSCCNYENPTEYNGQSNNPKTGTYWDGTKCIIPTP
jgi:hypothetical protein